MGAVHVTIDLENTGDAEVAARGLMPADKVRRYSARALVDTGAVLLVLPQDIVDHLGLRVRGKSVVTFANDKKEEWDNAGPVTVRVGNRVGNFDCVVGPPTSEPLFGQIPLEQLDLVVDPKNQTLSVRPESPIYPLYSLK